MTSAQAELDNPVTGMRLRELSDPQAGQSAALVWEARYPAHSPEPPPHFHPRQDERMEIVAGRLFARIAGEVRTLNPGDVLEIPAGTAHAMWTEAESATTVWRTMPALRTREFTRKLYDLARQGRTNERGVPGLLQAAVLLTAYRDVIGFVRPPRPVQRIVFGILAPIGRLLGLRAV